MAEVTFLGFGSVDGYGAEVGADVVLDGTGKPVVSPSQTRTYSSATNFDTDGKDETLGGLGLPVFDGGREVLNLGLALLDFDNVGKTVELGGTGAPLTTGSRLTPAITDFDTDNQDVELFPGGNPLNPGQVRFFTTPIKGPTFPVQGPTSPPGG